MKYSLHNWFLKLLFCSFEINALKVFTLHISVIYCTIRLLFTYVYYKFILQTYMICTNKILAIYNVATIRKYIHYSRTYFPWLIDGPTNRWFFALLLDPIWDLIAGVSSQCQIIVEGFCFTSNERPPSTQWHCSPNRYRAVYLHRRYFSKEYFMALDESHHTLHFGCISIYV